MSDTPNRRIPSAVQPIPTYRIDPAEVDKAFMAWVALRRAEQFAPDLAENEYFSALQDTAYARFQRLFEAM